MGDINNDGYDDILLGIPRSGDPLYSGQAFLLYGGNNNQFFNDIDLAHLDNSQGFQIIGPERGYELGRSLSRIGDMNGDGFDDFVVGTPNGDSGYNSYIGEGLIIFGSEQTLTGIFDQNQLDGSNGFTIKGKFRFSDVTAFASAGDINNDGFDDLIISDSSAFEGRDRNGAAYILFGQEEPYPEILSLSDIDGTNGFSMFGLNAIDFFGSTTSGLGDINGDGIDDFLIGGFGVDNGEMTNTGAAYVIFGRDENVQQFGASLDIGNLNGTTGFTIYGIRTFDNLISGAEAGDVNGDGINDIIVASAPSFVAGQGTAVGEAYIIYGSNDPFTSVFDLSELNGENGFVLRGLTYDSSLTVNLAGGGDVNGDGYDDLLIGTSIQETYMIFGSPSGHGGLLNLSDLDGVNGVIFTGSSSVFSALSINGDINGDGFDDIIVGG